MGIDRQPWLWGLALTCLMLASSAGAEPEASQVPGVVIDYSPASSGIYIGSPTITVLPNGDYLAAHDEFGPKSTEHTSAITHVFRSSDQGKSWAKIATIDGAFWSTLFVHRGDVYLIGPTHHHGDFVIHRSSDGGKNWTSPTDADTGLLLEGEYHCAPMPVIVHEGRLWRGVEDAGGGERWGARYRAMMVSAPIESDLLNAESWTASNYISRNADWLEGDFLGWLEGNAVVAPDGEIVDILRVSAGPKAGIAAVVNISDDGKKASFDPRTGFIKFPGGTKKFAIRHDPTTNLYWTLSNIISPWDAGGNPSSIRNTLALMSSPDMRNWTVRSIVLYHPDTKCHAFQYVDWLFEGDDLIAVSRTAYDDGQGGAHNAHDANYLTFHRIEDFRTLTMDDSAESWKQAKTAADD